MVETRSLKTTNFEDTARSDDKLNLTPMPNPIVRAALEIEGGAREIMVFQSCNVCRRIKYAFVVWKKGRMTFLLLL